MAHYGLGNFEYDLTVEGNNAKFKFFDPEDVTNTADVSLGEKDFPEGITAPDSRQVADVAYAQCQKVLNDKRDARIAKNEKEDLADRQAEEQRTREAAADFLNNAQDGAVAPAKVESDGTKVYNTAGPSEAAPKDAKK